MNNHTLIERSQKAVWHPCTQMKQLERFPLIPVKTAKGVWLYDMNGKRYLDAISSWWVNLFGHGHPKINAALHDQLESLEHVILAGCTHEPVVALSEKLSQITPGHGQLGHCFYGSDGASATEIALKMSFHYWQNIGQPEKKHFVSLKDGYHGETVGALSVTDVALFKKTYSPLIRSSYQVDSPDWRHAKDGEKATEYALRCVADVEAFLEQNHQHIAAFIVEPLVQGAAGMGMYDPIYLTHIRALCDRYEVHLIADEIAMGFGRTGTLFACEQANIVPDFMCLSKGITAGYLPLAVVLMTDKIYNAFYDDQVSRGFLHSHSYTGNALACRAALATLDLIEEEQIILQNQQKTLEFNLLCQELAIHPKVKFFRNRGMIWAFDVETNHSDFSSWFYQESIKYGILLRPIDKTVYIMPPYIINIDEFATIIQVILTLLAQVP